MGGFRRYQRCSREGRFSRNARWSPRSGHGRLEGWKHHCHSRLPRLPVTERVRPPVPLSRSPCRTPIRWSPGRSPRPGHCVRPEVRRTPAPARGLPQSQPRPSPPTKFVRSSRYPPVGDPEHGTAFERQVRAACAARLGTDARARRCSRSQLILRNFYFDGLLAVRMRDLHELACLYSRSIRPSPLAPAKNKSSTAQHMLSQLVSTGKRPITFLRRFTSSSERSNKLEDRNRLRTGGK